MAESWKDITNTESKRVQEIAALVRAGVESEVARANQLLLSYFFASLAFEDKDEDEQNWLKWRFSVLNEIIRETRAYKDIMEEGAVLALRQAVLDIVHERFPETVPSMKALLDTIYSSSVLRRVNVKMCTALTAQEAQHYLLTINEDQEKSQ